MSSEPERPPWHPLIAALGEFTDVDMDEELLAQTIWLCVHGRLPVVRIGGVFYVWSIEGFAESFERARAQPLPERWREEMELFHLNDGD